MDEHLRKLIDEENAKMESEACGHTKRYSLKFQYDGYNCVVTRTVYTDEKAPRHFFLCGYIHIPKWHRLHGVDIYGEDTAADVDLVRDLEVHGGVTYTGRRFDDGEWYIGFDCAHVGDLFIDEEIFMRSPDSRYRDLEYVQEECRCLVKQLKELGDA